MGVIASGESFSFSFSSIVSFCTFQQQPKKERKKKKKEKKKRRKRAYCSLNHDHANIPNLYSERMVLPLWRSLHSLNLMLPKEDRKAMLLRLYNEDTPLMDHSKDRFHANNNPKQETQADDNDINNAAAVKLESVKDEDEDNVKEEDQEMETEMDAHVYKYEDAAAVIKKEGGGGMVKDEDGETVGNGAGDEVRVKVEDGL